MNHSGEGRLRVSTRWRDPGRQLIGGRRCNAREVRRRARSLIGPSPDQFDASPGRTGCITVLEFVARDAEGALLQAAVPVGIGARLDLEADVLVVHRVPAEMGTLPATTAWISSGVPLTRLAAAKGGRASRERWRSRGLMMSLMNVAGRAECQLQAAWPCAVKAPPAPMSTAVQGLTPRDEMPRSAPECGGR